MLEEEEEEVDLVGIPPGEFRPADHVWLLLQEGRCKATWKREFNFPWREAGPPNHHDDKVDSDQ